MVLENTHRHIIIIIIVIIIIINDTKVSPIQRNSQNILLIDKNSVKIIFIADTIYNDTLKKEKRFLFDL